MEVQCESGPKLVDWKKALVADGAHKDKVKSLAKEVEQLASKFPIPGHEEF
jgi:hypothetical protein